MGENDLTPANFVMKIKSMGDRERSKISSKKLIELICQVPDPTESIELAELRASIEHVTRMASVNQTEILSLKTSNEEHVRMNRSLQHEIGLLKEHAQECTEHRQQPAAPQPRQPQQQPQQHNDDIDNIRQEIAGLKAELNSIQQYLRVNNLEIVGLPAANDGETEETLLINALNDLDGLEEIIRPSDIDISHPLNSKRKDGKSVHVVRFVSRKTKAMILSAKKRDANKQFKFRNCDVFVNEHLSMHNLSLLLPRRKRITYKYCWTRGGTVFMRKGDETPIFTISTGDDLDKLVLVVCLSCNRVCHPAGIVISEKMQLFRK